MILEIAAVILEVIIVHSFQSGMFQAKERSPFVIIASYLLFGACSAAVSILFPSLILLPLTTFVGIFLLSFFLYQGHLFSHLYMSFLLLTIGIIAEILVAGFHSGIINVQLQQLHVANADRMLGLLTAKIICFAVTRLILLFRTRFQETLGEKIWQSIPLILCQFACIFLLTQSFMRSYRDYGILTDGVILEILCILFISVVIFWFYDLLVTVQKVRMDQAMAQVNLEYQHKHYESYERQMERIAALDHDIKKHMLTLSGLVERGQIETAGAYISDLSAEMDHRMKVVWSDNHVVNAILTHLMERAEELNFRPEMELSIPPQLKIAPIDITAILGNTIDNALEALAEVPPGNRILSLHLKQKGQLLAYEIKNPYDKLSRPKGQKDDRRRGYGLKNVKEAVHRYGGHMTTQDENGVFSVSIII